jgi:hypothetical protein
VNTLISSVFSVFSVAKSIDPSPIEAAKTMNHGKHGKHGNPRFSGVLARALWLRAGSERREVRTVSAATASVLSVLSVAKSIDPSPIQTAKR